MKKIFSSLVFFLTLTGASQWGQAFPLKDPVTQAPSQRSTAALKKYMSKFGVDLAGLEIMMLKEKKPDWEVVDDAIRDMSATLVEMQKADKQAVYKQYTDMLAAGLAEFKTKAAQRDPNLPAAVEKLSDTCFKCHAAHRPSDYPLPPKNKNLGAQNPASY